MCGRFSRKATLQAIIDEFEVEEVTSSIEPSYNVAPGQQVAVIIDSEKRKLGTMKWGFIPSWSKDPAIGSRMINARAETVAEKPSFRNSFRRKRCLIVADGFFEWKREENGKIPMHVVMKSGRPFGFAGLWEIWISPEGEKTATCTIITTSPNSLMEPIHNRMPVILPKQQTGTWLNPKLEDSAALLPLLLPYRAEEMEAYPVSKLVNSPKNNSSEVIVPLER